MIEASVVLDSVGEHSPRLTTFQLRYPRIIHDEFLTYRMAARNASSSRAVPALRMIAEAEDPALRAYPVRWLYDQPGMQGYEEMTPGDAAIAKDVWDESAIDAARHARRMLKLPLHPPHKQLVNRVLMPYVHINVVATAVEDAWLNLFGQRLHHAADPTMRAVAEAMWAAWQGSTPTRLQPDEWHLPYVDVGHPIPRIGYRGEDSYPLALAVTEAGLPEWEGYIDCARRVSVARCARVSYLSFETGRRSTVEEDLRLYDRLVSAQPLHASPAEHQATPDEWSYTGKEMAGMPEKDWCNPDEHGPFRGWRQLRKTLPGEAVAPLPEGYVL